MSNKPDEAADKLWRFLTVPEVADLLGLCERQVWRLIARKDIRKTAFGRAARVSEEDVRDYVRRAQNAEVKKRKKNNRE